MKCLLITMVTISLLPFSAHCQSHDSEIPNSNHSGNTIHYIYSGPLVFLDTTWIESVRPDSILVYYYNIKGKYPESSETIKENARIYLQNTGHLYTESGYITFRFFVDSTGQMLPRVQLIQTDEFYKAHVFDENLVWNLFKYLKTMKRWKPAPALIGTPRYYINILSFKMNEGKLVDIIP